MRETADASAQFVFEEVLARVRAAGAGPLPAERPAAVLHQRAGVVAVAVDAGPGQQDVLVAGQRERVVVVFQEDQRLLCHRLSGLLCAAEHVPDAGLVDRRLFEQAEVSLQFKTPPNSLVDALHGNRAVLDESDDGVDELDRSRRVAAVADHVHVDTGVDGHLGRRFEIGRVVVVRNHPVEVVPVRDDHPLVAVGVPEQRRQQPVGGVGRNSVYRPAVDHHRPGLGLQCLPVRREDVRPEVTQRRRGRCAVVAVVRDRVGREVFDTRRQPVVVLERSRSYP